MVMPFVLNSETDNERDIHKRLIVSLKDEINYLRSKLQ